MTKGATRADGVAPRTIVVGAGLMGRHHARAAAATGASIVAIVDRDEGRSAALASRFNGAASVADFEQLAASIDADVVHICTPASSHVALGKLSAAAGLHALIEKPLAPDGESTATLLDQFRRANLIACPAHQYAFQQSVRTTVDAMPKLGAVHHVAFDICSAGAARSGMDLDALVGEILPHPLAMLQKLVPEVNVGSADWSCVRSAPGEWLIAAPLGGTLVTMIMSMSGRPTRFMTKITADRGTVELDNFHDFAVSWPGQVSTAQKIASPFIRGGLGLFGASRNLLGRAVRREFAYPGLATLVEEFYAAVREKRVAPITPAEAIAVASARDRISELARNG